MPEGITVVGLGPGEPGCLTMEAWAVLESADEIYLRTRKHPTVALVPSSAHVHSFDDIYERADTLEELHAEIASHIVGLGTRAEGVIYAVPGHPLVGENSVLRILALARQRGVAVRIVEGLSFLEPICTQIELDPLSGLQVADAVMLAQRHYPLFNPDLPLLIGQLNSRDLASEVKLALMMVYPDEHPVTLLACAGMASESLRVVPLYKLDRCEGTDCPTSLYVPPLPTSGSVAVFQELVARLRAPDGCPWDREQTHRSLRPFLLEETHEVLQALDDEDIPSLQDELGDLLLQILLHTQIAIEQAEFKMADVVSHIVDKLRHRHPHVFGETQVASSREVLVNWERIKSEERNHKSPRSMLAGVPAAMPALARAQALQRRGAHAGVDWPDLDAVWNEVDQGRKELRKAAEADAQETELGNLLFSLVSLARWLDVDAESALRGATARFEKLYPKMGHCGVSQRRE